MKKPTWIIFILSSALILSAVSDSMGNRGTVVRLIPNDNRNSSESGVVELYNSSYALVIGIDVYTGGLPTLSKAVEDAEKVAEALREKRFDVEFKKNLNSDELADAFKKFFIRKGSEEEARLFVWFAGHGKTIDGEGFLAPADAPKADEEILFKEKALPMRRFGEYMRLAKAKHIYAVFDSCFSGTIFSSTRSGPPKTIINATTARVRQFLSSGDKDQRVSDDGRFRKFFINALQGDARANANNDKYLTASEIGSFIRDRMINHPNSKQTPKYGKLWDKDFGEGDFVFVLPTGEIDPDYSKDKESDFWKSIQYSEKIEDFEKYLTKFSGGVFADSAKTRIAHLKEIKTPDVRKPKVIANDGRFVAYDNGTVMDTKTGLMWASEDNGEDIDWNHAKEYCDTYRGGGYMDWRLPTADDLMGLYDEKQEGYKPEYAKSNWTVKLTKFIRITCYCPWTSYAYHSDATYFNFFNGNSVNGLRTSFGCRRVLPVRGGK